MSKEEPPRTPLSQRLIVIGTAVFAISVVLLAVQRTSRTSSREGSASPVVLEVMEPATENPIVSEASVFHRGPGTFALDPETRRRPNARPRTVATYRLLRSYPGAPPRVPHGLTSTEFRTNRCNTCHERGGFSQRFGAYAPVNPHPEWVTCLQCHATNEALVGLPFPQHRPDDTCRQCHSGGPARFDETGLDWRPALWPSVGVWSPGHVPVIPHDLETRGNCLSCHTGPGSVAEIRMRHPEWSNCRQCHLTVTTRDVEFTRPASAGAIP
jgi:cytochrome c-type protein NapB